MKLVKLTKTDEFSSVFGFRKRMYGAWLIANYKPNTLTKHRFGLVVPKKVAKHAVRRNYMKRVLRSLLQQSLPVNAGSDIVFQVKKSFTNQDYPKVSQELHYLLGKINKLSSSV